MNKRYNNVAMLKRNLDRIYAAPYYAKAARQLIEQAKRDERCAYLQMDEPYFKATALN